MINIGFDLDGVLYDFHTIAHEELVLHHKLKLSYNEFWSHWRDFYSEKFYSEFVKIPTLYESTLPSKDTTDVLDYLKNKYCIYYLTSRPVDVKFVTDWWMKSNNFPYLENVVFTGKDKTKEVRLCDCKYFIEDVGDQEKIDALNKVTNLILLDQVWNKNVTNVVRIKRLKELINLL